ncbi:MAG: Flp pilus assembly complex ATPase component [Candidatus Diapherotrites archaeon]|nr:Flp pilus assembly complex ATPase component [Candidatus Diapherotrites archaeon]
MVRLVLREGAEEVIREHCPYRDPAVARCLHCPPEEAPCLRSEGVYECVKGVLCAEGGVPEDTELCPHGALRWSWRLESLYKCDLCVNSHGYPLCYLKGNGSVDIELNEKDLNEVGELLGWLFYGEAPYKIELPPIFPWEARIASRVIDLFLKTRGEYSPEEILEELSEELLIPPYTRQRVLWLLDISLSPLGPLNLIKGDDIEEVVVVGLRRPVKVFKRGVGWINTNLYIWTEEYFLSLVNRAGESLGRRISISSPRLNAVLPDGSRIHAVIPPLSNVHSLTVRRFSTQPLTVSHLLYNLLRPEEAALLWIAMEREKNVLIAGNTGSGKTTLLNALFGFVPLEERIVAVEEVPELRIPHPHFIRMIPRHDIPMKDLIRDTLRMRPDRVVVGEIRRDDEAEAFIDTVLAGQGRGSYATVHGRSVREVKSRLLSMGIREIDLDSIDVVVVLRRWGEGGRIVRQLVEMGSFGGDLLEVLDVDEEEVQRRAKILDRERIYDLEAFARRFGGAGETG